jgi:two-component system phosphate regulon response regulator PhoB
MRNEILIVQPDPEQSAAIRCVLESHGYAVSEAATVETANARMSREMPDAVLLHWCSPGTIQSFLNSFRGANGQSNACAIVTALDNELGDALSALDMGCDDCLRIPTDETELLARLNASLKRRIRRRKSQISHGALFLDKDVHCLCINGEPVTLAPTEFRLLSFFLENPGRVLSREEILKGAWQRNITTGSRTVDVHVRRLRQILEPYHCDSLIQTVRSFGYRFRQDRASS